MSGYNNNIVGYTLSNKVGLHYEEEKKYAIGIDRIRTNLKAKDEKVVFNYTTLVEKYKSEGKGIYNIDDLFFLNMCSKRVGGYMYTFDISIESRKVGTLSCNNYDNTTEGIVQLEFVNDVHYSMGKGWLWYYRLITEALSLKLENISYLEIALDMNDIFERYKYMHQNSTMAGGTLFRHVGKITLDTFKSYKEFKVGTTGSGKWIVIYNKSSEIESNRKHYITKSHEHRGLDTSKQIDRIELRMNSKGTKKYGITLDMLDSEEGLCSIFKEYTKDSLSFFDQSTQRYDKHRNTKYERIDLIDYSIFDCKPLERPERKQKATAGKTTRSTTGAFKHHLYNYIAEGREEDVNLMRDYITREANWLVGHHAYSSHFVTLEKLEQSNLKEYRKLLRRYVSEYKAAIDERVLWRLRNVETVLFMRIETCYLAR